MLGTKEIAKEAESLPVEERAILVDCILKTLNPVVPELEKEWAETAKRRANELRSGKVQAIPGEDVFDAIRSRLRK